MCRCLGVLCARVFLLFAKCILWPAFMLLDLLLGIFVYPTRWVRHCRYSRTMRTPYTPLGCKTVVIVGGNFAGLKALYEFYGDCRFKVILIDQREYFEYTPGVLRLFCEPSLFSDLARRIPKGTHEFVLGMVVRTSSEHVEVVMDNGSTKRIIFDYLIMAMGANYGQPISSMRTEASLESRKATWETEAAKVRAANHVLVLGGGAVGVELAAEVADYFPDKRVTLVQSGPHLVPLFPEKSIARTEWWLRAKEPAMTLLLGQRVERWDEAGCTLQSGERIDADCIFPCFGLKCNSQSLSAGDLERCLSSRQEVLVNEHMQLNGHEHVFSAGDVMQTTPKEIKQAYYAEMTGHLAAENVIRHSQGKPLHKYPDHLAGWGYMPLVAIVSLGRYDGSLVFNEFELGGILAALMKWILEWTKVAAMEWRPVGLLVWAIGDGITFFLSRWCCCRPKASYTG